MSASVTLTLRAGVDVPVSLHRVQPADLGGMSESEIARTMVTAGRRQVPLGDLFTVEGGRSIQIRVVGATRNLQGLGAGMTAGELIVEGDAGADLGAGMTAGSIRLLGSAAEGAGAGMGGGLLRIEGEAGDRLGGALPGAAKGMTGGEIIVAGSTGIEAGARLRRGLIVVAGNTGPYPGRAMIAGSLIIFGACGEHPGRGNRRGSIVACGSITIPATYRYACTLQPPHVRVTLLHLQRRRGLAIPIALVGATFRRYCGDAGDPGKGEILAFGAHDGDARN